MMKKMIGIMMVGINIDMYFLIGLGIVVVVVFGLNELFIRIIFSDVILEIYF